MLPFAMLMLLSASSSSLFGYWETPAHSVIQVEPCRPYSNQNTSPDVCLRVVRLPPEAPARTDIHNPDASLHSRPLCGLVVGTGFRQDEPGRLAGGRLYDPKSGHTYQGTITIAGDSLQLRGYIGISLFGRSETWQRVDPVAGCS